MKWKKRQREIKRLRAAHAGRHWRNPFPDLKDGLDSRKIAPCNNILDLYGAEAKPPLPATNLIVDHFHKSGMQVILPSELPWAGGKKP
jgi:hypothetical protein